MKNFKRPENNQIPSMRPKPKAFVELAMENESFPVQDRACIVAHHIHLPDVASAGLKQPIDRSVCGIFFLNHRVKPGQTARPGGEDGGSSPIGQPLVYVHTREFPC